MASYFAQAIGLFLTSGDLPPFEKLVKQHPKLLDARRHELPDAKQLTLLNIHQQELLDENQHPESLDGNQCPELMTVKTNVRSLLTFAVLCDRHRIANFLNK